MGLSDYQSHPRGRGRLFNLSYLTIKRPRDFGGSIPPKSPKSPQIADLAQRNAVEGGADGFMEFALFAMQRPALLAARRRQKRLGFAEARLCLRTKKPEKCRLPTVTKAGYRPHAQTAPVILPKSGGISKVSLIITAENIGKATVCILQTVIFMPIYTLCNSLAATNILPLT